MFAVATSEWQKKTRVFVGGGKINDKSEKLRHGDIGIGG